METTEMVGKVVRYGHRPWLTRGYVVTREIVIMRDITLNPVNGVFTPENCSECSGETFYVKLGTSIPLCAECARKPEPVAKTPWNQPVGELAFTHTDIVEESCRKVQALFHEEAARLHRKAAEDHDTAARILRMRG